jgi:hypothetical protein
MVARCGPSVRRIAGSRRDEVAFHRFLRNLKVTAAEMLHTAAARTGANVSGRDIAVIQDTTEIVVGGKEAARAGFGPVGKGGATRGFLAHLAIAVDDAGALIGLAGGAVWTRTSGEVETDRSRAFEEKESYRWLETFEAACTACAGARSITLVADCECDIYGVYVLRPAASDILVRAYHDRKLVGGGQLSTAMEKSDGKVLINREIPAARGRKKRTATLTLEWRRVEIAAPQDTPRNLPRSITMTVLEVREDAPPQGAPEIFWRLLTTHDIPDARRAGEILDLYRSRFQIEQVFRTLKTAGFDIESAEIERPAALMNFATLALIASVTIMQLVRARDGATGQPVEHAFDAADKPLLVALSKRLEGKTAKQKNPHPPDSLAFASWTLGRLGGWTGYYGKPGPAVVRYGLEQFAVVRLGASIAKDV